MRNYNKWNELQEKSGKVVLEHKLFGKQEYECGDIQVVNDDEKIGVKIKGQELFVRKQNLVEFEIDETRYAVSDDLLEISVIVNKL